MALQSEKPDTGDQSTRERLIMVAERLFAQQDYGSVSVRAINAAAGANAAAVHYHFGSKEALVASILELRMDKLDEQRTVLRDEMLEADGSLTARQVVELLVQPLLDLMRSDPESGPTYVQLLTRLYLERDVIIHRRAPVVDQWWRDVLALALPDLPNEVMYLRWLIIVDSAFVALSRRFVCEDSFEHPMMGWDAAAEELIDLLARGLDDR